MLSIIIPAKNEEKYLPHLLSDLKKQSLKDFEVIVAEKGSKDKTREIAKQFGATVTEGGNHPSVARNNGAKVAKGNVLAFLDADVRIFDKDFISRASDKFLHKKYGVACFFAKANSDEFFYNFLFFWVNFFCFLLQKIRPRGGGFCIFCRRSLFEKVSGFDEKINLGEDIYFLEQVKKFGFRYFWKPRIHLSVRRFEEEGKWNLLKKYIKSTFLEICNKHKDKDIEYDFDYDKG